MEIARKTYLFVAALFVFLVAGWPTEAEAQGGGLTCGWCIMERWELTIGDLIFVGPWEHQFPGGGNGCGWDGRDEVGAMCSRCGGTSDCHREFRTGGCHIACGPAGGDVAAALTEVEDALEAGDVTAVASALLEPRSGFSFDFIPEAGRIDLFRDCTPNRPLRTIPVPPATRDRLATAFQGSVRTEKAEAASVGPSAVRLPD